MKGLLLLVACLLGSCRAQEVEKCPPESLVRPCRCTTQSMDCSDVQNPVQLQSAITTGFRDIKEFNQLMIKGSSITLLTADVFRPIRARIFTIAENIYLTYIDENAFGGSESFVRLLYLQQNNLQGVDIFVAMTKMNGLAAAYLNQNKLSSVPERALAGMPELAHVDLSSNRISSLGREAFADCPKLQSVILSNNELRVLPSRILAADTFPASIAERVSLVLSNNQIEAMAPDALDGIEKRIEIVLNENRIQSLPKEIFKPLLDRLLQKVGSNNIIVLHDNPFNCDCSMKWVLQNRDYFKILNSVTCTNRQKPLRLYTLDDFRECKS